MMPLLLHSQQSISTSIDITNNCTMTACRNSSRINSPGSHNKHTNNYNNNSNNNYNNCNSSNNYNNSNNNNNNNNNSATYINDGIRYRKNKPALIGASINSDIIVEKALPSPGKQKVTKELTKKNQHDIRSSGSSSSSDTINWNNDCFLISEKSPVRMRRKSTRTSCIVAEKCNKTNNYSNNEEEEQEEVVVDKNLSWDKSVGDLQSLQLSPLQIHEEKKEEDRTPKEESKERTLLGRATNFTAMPLSPSISISSMKSRKKKRILRETSIMSLVTVKTSNNLSQTNLHNAVNNDKNDNPEDNDALRTVGGHSNTYIDKQNEERRSVAKNEDKIYNKPIFNKQYLTALDEQKSSIAALRPPQRRKVRWSYLSASSSSSSQNQQRFQQQQQHHPKRWNSWNESSNSCNNLSNSSITNFWGQGMSSSISSLSTDLLLPNSSSLSNSMLIEEISLSDLQLLPGMELLGSYCAMNRSQSSVDLESAPASVNKVVLDRQDDTQSLTGSGFKSAPTIATPSGLTTSTGIASPPQQLRKWDTNHLEFAVRKCLICIDKYHHETSRLSEKIDAVQAKNYSLRKNIAEQLERRAAKMKNKKNHRRFLRKTTSTTSTTSSPSTTKKAQPCHHTNANENVKNCLFEDSCTTVTETTIPNWLEDDAKQLDHELYELEHQMQLLQQEIDDHIRQLAITPTTTTTVSVPQDTSFQLDKVFSQTSSSKSSKQKCPTVEVRKKKETSDNDRTARKYDVKCESLQQRRMNDEKQTPNNL